MHIAWRTGDGVLEEDGRPYFQGRTDDVTISAGYRIRTASGKARRGGLRRSPSPAWP